MSRRMSSWWLWTLSVAWSLLFVASVQADPPTAKLAPLQPVDREAAQIQIEAIVWDIDHAKLRALTKSELGVHEFYKTNGLIKQPEPDWIAAVIADAIGLAPPGRKAVAAPPLPLRAVAIRRNMVSMNLLGEDITSACKTMAEPSLVVTSGREASFLSGGEVPIVAPRTGDPAVVDWHEFGLKLKVLPKLVDQNRVSLFLDFADTEVQEPSTQSGDSEVRLLHSRGFQLSAQMKLGERLLVAQQTGKQEVTRLVELQPTLVAGIAAVEQGPSNAKGNSNLSPGVVPQPMPSAASAPLVSTPKPRADATNARAAVPDGTVTVEDRWPLGEIKIGQQVIPVPVTIEKTRLIADVRLIQFIRKTTSWPKVTRVEPLPKQAGRRVTITWPLIPADDAPAAEFFQKQRTHIVERMDSSTTTFVVPMSSLSVNDIYDARFVDRLYDQIPAALRPRPVEIAVGDKFMATGLMSLLGKFSKAGDTAEHGPFSMELMNANFCGRWRAIATKPGMTRLVEMQIEMQDGDDFIGAAHVTEYLVKADTRELEHHIREQFPTAQVTITSVGTNSLLLRGTVSSDEDSRGIAELAEQFAPNILNRLKVGATEASNEPRRMGTPARPAVVRIDEPQIATEPNPIDPITTGTGKSAHPTRVKPASAASSKKNDQLRELLDEIRELRQDVRRLSERLRQEQRVAAPFNNSSGASHEAEVRTPIEIHAQPISAEANNSRSVLVNYTVPDLVAPLKDVHILLRGDNSALKGDRESRVHYRLMSVEQLRDFIISAVRPESWSDRGGDGIIKIDERRLGLVVQQSQSVHDEVRDLLEKLRRLQAPQVSFELHLIRADKRCLDEFQFPKLDEKTGNRSWSEIISESINVAEWLKMLSASNHARVISLPKVELFNCQRLTLATDSESSLGPLHLSTSHSASAKHRFVRMKCSAAPKAAGLTKNFSIMTVRDGQSWLMDLTDSLRDEPPKAVPIFDIVPHMRELFPNGGPKIAFEPKDAIFLLATPRVIVDAEIEVESLIGLPE